MRSPELNRRNFLAATMAGLVTATSSAAESQAAPQAAFFVVGDTHYFANKEEPGELNTASAETCGRLVETLNRLSGADIPPEAGGGKVATVNGVLHAGDVIDTGDKAGRVQDVMQATEWAAFERDYGLTGMDGKLKTPVYETIGNHDAPHGVGLALEQIRRRNKTRPGVCAVSATGLHYSWNWGQAHFISLGLIVGNDKGIDRKRRYAALDSLDFLVEDLKAQVGTSGRPVILMHHVDIARYTGLCDPTQAFSGKEWDPCDVLAFHRAIKHFNVAGIFYGHTHARNVFRWDGQSAKASAGIAVFNTDNASHFHSDQQAFLYAELYQDRLLVREYATKDRWQTGAFAPQAWRVSIV